MQNSALCRVTEIEREGGIFDDYERKKKMEEQQQESEEPKEERSNNFQLGTRDDANAAHEFLQQLKEFASTNIGRRHHSLLLDPDKENPVSGGKFSNTSHNVTIASLEIIVLSKTKQLQD